MSDRRAKISTFVFADFTRHWHPRRRVLICPHMNNVFLGVGAPRRIGFLSTRFHGTDGVTLEARKWAGICVEQGHSCFWMAGLLDTPPESSHHVPLAYFNHPEIVTLQGQLYGKVTRSRAVTNQIQAVKEQLKDEIY